MTEIWTTAHLAALAWADAAFPLAPQPEDLSSQTVRQAVRLRRGGTAVRLVLSNEYGQAPLVLDGLTVSRCGGEGAGKGAGEGKGKGAGGRPGAGRNTGASSGASVSETPALPVLWHGRARWEIPPGETATSDPVALPTATGDEIVVSCHLTGLAPAASYLHSAQRTGHRAPGNQLEQRELTKAEPFPSLYWIARVLVDTPAQGPVVVAFGDSITRGDHTTDDRDQRYPDHLQRALLAAGARDVAVLNAGLGANRLLRTGLGPSMTDRFARDVLVVTEATHVIIMGGVNDLGFAAIPGQQPVTADEISAGLFALAARAQRHGLQPVLGTITPTGGSVSESFRAEGNEAVRRAVNHAVAAQQDWPLADFAAAVAAPDEPARLNPAFDSGDGVHPNDAGARALAAAIHPAADRRLRGLRGLCSAATRSP